MIGDDGRRKGNRGLYYIFIFFIICLGSILAAVIYVNKMIDSLVASDMAYF